MMKKEIKCTEAPAAVGSYSQAVEVSGTVFVSGQLGMTKDKVFGDNVAAEARQSLTNIESILKEAGYRMEDVVKTTIFLTDINDFKDVNEVYGAFFTAPYPSRSTFAVKELPLGAKIEIEAIAKK